MLNIDTTVYRSLCNCREDLSDESLMEAAPADRSQLLAPPKADSSHKNRAKSRKRCKLMLDMMEEDIFMTL